MAQRPPRRKPPARKPRRAAAPAAGKISAPRGSLRHDEEFLVTLFNVARIGICLTDENGFFVRVNPAFCELFGQRAAELIRTPGASRARPFLDFVYPDDRALVLDNHRKRIRGEPVTAYYPFRIIDKAGRVRWLEISAELMKWEGRRTTVSFLLDVTERRALQHDLQQSLVEREAILNNSLVGIAFVAADNRIKWSNRTFEQLYGYGKGELAGRHAEFAYPSREAYYELGRAAAAVIKAGGIFEQEVEMQRKDGARFSAFVSGKAIDPADLSRGAVWVVRDITPRKKLENELNRSLLEREAILHSTLVGITFAVDRRLLWVNDTFARMLGYERGELIGQLSLVHFPDQESFDAFGDAAYPALASGRPYVTEQQMKRKDGSLIWCQLYGNALDPADLARGSIWTNIDITERKRAEGEIRRALEKERELNELKSRFVAMTSHEFRTPLATILSSAELLEHYSARLPAEEKQEMFDSIRAGVERMAKMLDDVLMIGRVEAQMIEFNPAPLNLAAFCQQLADEMQRSLTAGHAIDFAFDGRRNDVNMDEKLLRHVLGNLLSNAVKYSPQGGTVGFRVRLRNGVAEFEVTDQGIGIPPEDRSRLFESFHRARNVGSIAGTGLGLAIVKKSVDLQRGSIEFASQVGKGTRFTVSIPVY